jgi:hypothetical protein
LPGGEVSMPGILASSAGLPSPASLTTPIGTNSGDTVAARQACPSHHGTST